MNFKCFINNDYFFSVISRVLGVLTGVVYVALFSRYFGVELKGESSIILNYISIFSIVLDCGINQSYAFFRKNDSNFKSKYIRLIRWMFLLFFVLAFALILTCENIIFKTCCLILPIRILTNQINNIILIETPKKRNLSSIILNCVDIVLVLSMWFIVFPSQKVLVDFLFIKEVLYLGIGIFILGRDFLMHCNESVEMLPLVRFGISVMICLLMMEINYRIDVIMLNGHASKYNIGLYSVAVSLAERVWLVPDALRDILMSKLVKGKNDQEVAKVTRISLAVSVVLVLLIVVFGKLMIWIMFGKSYIGAYNVTVIVMFGVLSMVFYKTIYAFYNVMGKQKLNVIILSSTACLNIMGNFLLIPHFDIYGAAIASVLSYTFCGIIYLISFSKITQIPVYEICIVKISDIRRFFNTLKKNK